MIELAVRWFFTTFVLLVISLIGVDFTHNAETEFGKKVWYFSKATTILSVTGLVATIIWIIWTVKP